MIEKKKKVQQLFFKSCTLYPEETKKENSMDEVHSRAVRHAPINSPQQVSVFQ